MPASGQKYLYERLTAGDFQLLVNAVMPFAFEGYRPLPLGQADGGRDGVSVVAGETLVFQVKWSGTGRHKDPVSWLAGVVRGEETNLRRLAQEGVRRYVLVTNVPSTGKPGTGMFDRLNQKFEQYAKEFGFEAMTCVWREGLDSFLDSTPSEIKWVYADMLAGWDLIRYLVAEQFGASSDRGLRDLVRNVALAQWGDDELVKFSQVDVDRERVADLFIDITGERLRGVEVPTASAARARSVRPEFPPARNHVGGTAAYLLATKAPATLVRGAPGQGKSTLTQYVSQSHRAAFVPVELRPVELPTPALPRFPLRADLSEYTRWRQGYDVFDPAVADASGSNLGTTAQRVKRPKARPAPRATLECFLGELMTYASGGSRVNALEVQELFKRLPSMVVLDGLDEVGSLQMREKVVDAIDKFTRRARGYPVPVQVVVTTRPSNNELPEPAADLFEVISLNELAEDQRADYLRKWCAVRDIRGRDGRQLRKSFKAKSEEPYIADLAGNPMQLTILLDLIHERGAATPTQRTDLYDHYVDLLLAREANKHPDSVKKHREQLKEIMPFVGWYLQSRSEEQALPGRMTVVELQAAMRHFQHCYGKPQNAVHELFEAATDRLWALTSKDEGTYEFEVLSLREYFAARFLYHWAGEDQRGFDHGWVLRELLRRPEWLNTARFYGGNAEGRDVAALADGIIDELREGCSPQARAAAWTLLTDGVLQSRPRRAREVIDALLGDDGLSALLEALGRKEIRPLPALPQLPEGDGPDLAWTRMTSQIAAAPEDPGSHMRVRAVRELLNQRTPFATWWTSRAKAAAGTSAQDSWLKVAAACEAAAGVALDLDGLSFEPNPDAPTYSALPAQLVLNSGLTPTSKSPFEVRLLRAVLDGECPEVTSIRSMPAQVAVALRPMAFVSRTESGFHDVNEGYAQRRPDAIARLRKTAPDFAKVASQRRFKQGQKGSTFPWSDASTALFDVAGRCWLASEIAIIGAASPQRDGFSRQPGATAFGQDSHPAELLAQTRGHLEDAAWWREQLAVVVAGDASVDLFRAEWALALWAIPSGHVIPELLNDWEDVMTGLTERRRRVIFRAARDLTWLGRLKGGPVEGTLSDNRLRQLLEARQPAAPKVKREAHRRPVPTPARRLPSLASVARDGDWFKVDATATYR